MKRFALVLGAVLALCSVAPARAHSVTGQVWLPAAAPNPQRIGTITHAMPNGTMGYVVDLDHGATNNQYALTLTDGATGLEELDVYFYYSLDGVGDPCPIPTDKVRNGNTETGTACPTNGPKRARYAIVVLNNGALAEFTLSV